MMSPVRMVNGAAIVLFTVVMSGCYDPSGPIPEVKKRDSSDNAADADAALLMAP